MNLKLPLNNTLLLPVSKGLWKLDSESDNNRVFYTLRFKIFQESIA